jgi:hypothetical protein
VSGGTSLVAFPAFLLDTSLLPAFSFWLDTILFSLGVLSVKSSWGGQKSVKGKDTFLFFSFFFWTTKSSALYPLELYPKKLFSSTLS